MREAGVRLLPFSGRTFYLTSNGGSASAQKINDQNYQTHN